VRRFIKARAPHISGAMNKTEAAYALWLQSEEKYGFITKALPFGSITFKLADDTRYTPDFPVVLPDGTLELRDTKGSKAKKIAGVKIGTQPYVEEDALIKIKVAAERFPEFRWALVWLDKDSGWLRREF
jgi:hypothetical protein